MTSPESSSGSGRGSVYEISVAGPLGPVLRHALSPCRTGGTSYDTVVRVTGREGEDLADVLGRLGSMGLELSTITVVT
jgi:hypothetical protein